MSHHPDDPFESDSESSVDVEEERPKRWAVILHNDDYTTMEFVLEVLTTVFRLTLDQAQAIMMKVHFEGQGVAGIYPHEIAETKADRVVRMARQRGFPLLATIEPASSE